MIQAAALLLLGTPDSLEEAVTLLRQTVYGFSLNFCRNREDAEDVTQEVLFRSLKHLWRFHDPDSLAVWLYVVTKNQYRRMNRTAQRHSANMIPIDSLPFERCNSAYLPGDLHMSPEATLVRMEEVQLLRRAILRVPTTLRSVLVLHDLKEFTTSEVAEVLRLRQGTIRVRLHRARLRVRNEIDRILTGELREV